MAMNFYEKVVTLGEIFYKLAGEECENFTKIYKIYDETKEEEKEKLDSRISRIGENWDYLIDVYYRDLYLSDILEIIDNIMADICLYVGEKNLTKDEKWILEQIIEF